MIYALAVSTLALAATSSSPVDAAALVRGAHVPHGETPGSHTVIASVRSPHHKTKGRIANRVKNSRFKEGVEAFATRMKAKAKSPAESMATNAAHSVTAVTYGTGTAQEIIYTTTDTSCSKSPGAMFSYSLGYCSTLAADESYKLTCTSDQGVSTVTIHYYGTSNCSGDETGTAEESYAEGCSFGLKYQCSLDTQPWTAHDPNKNGYWRESSFDTQQQCFSDYTSIYAPEAYIMYPGRCIYGFKGNECSAEGANVDYYNDDECKSYLGTDHFDLSGCDAVVDDDDQSVTYDASVCTYYTEDESTCFAADSLVTTIEGKNKRIADIERGDRIKTISNDGATSFSEVAHVVHEPNTEASTFVTLRVATGESLKVTPEHIVPAGACDRTASLQSMPLVRAGTVQVGDCLYTPSGQQRVVSTSSTKGNGIYSVVTTEMSGLLVVDGIVASSFGSSHSIPNTYYHMHRVMYHIPGVSALMGTRLVQRVNALFGDVAVAFGRALRIV